MNFSQIFRAWLSSILINFMVNSWKMVNNEVVRAIKGLKPMKGDTKTISLLSAFGFDVKLHWKNTHWIITVYGLVSKEGVIYYISQRLGNGAWAYNTKVAKHIEDIWREQSCYSEVIRGAMLNTVITRFWLKSLKTFSITDRLMARLRVVFFQPDTPTHKSDEKIKDLVVDEYFKIHGTLKASLFMKYTGKLFLDFKSDEISGPLGGVFLYSLPRGEVSVEELPAGSLALEINKAWETMLK